MNPITNTKNIQKLNQRELELGIVGKKSWHDEYKDSAWVFIGGLPYDLTEGDIICVFSQYGEIVNINLVRDKATGKSKGFAFLCYQDQRSTVLAVDNLNCIKLLGRIIRVDHVADYKKPKEKEDEDDLTQKLRAEGCAPKVSVPQLPTMPQSLADDLPQTLRPPSTAAKPKKAKKDKKKKKKKKKKMKVTVKVEHESESDSSSSESSDNDDDDDDRKRKQKRRSSPIIDPDSMKREKQDRGYDRALHGHRHLSGKLGRAGDVKPDPDQSGSRARHDIATKREPDDSGRDRYKERNITVKKEPSDSGRERYKERAVSMKRESSDSERDEVSVKREPEDSGRERHKRKGERRDDKSHRDRHRNEDRHGHRHSDDRHSDEDRDRRRHRHSDDRHDRHRDRDEYDKKRR